MKFEVVKSDSFFQTSTYITFQNRFFLKRLVRKYPRFHHYEGIDITANKFVSIYIKRAANSFNYSKKVKAQLKNKLSPHVLWEGSHKQESTILNVQIHEKYGPSLKQMFECVKEKITLKDFLHLMYQMIKLIEKYSSVGYVCRQLDLEEIVFDPKPEKCQLYLLNTFSLRKKGQNCPELLGKFSSKGAHLGLRASYKDDLESMCYILLHIYTGGQFLSNVTPGNYIHEKAKIDFNSMGRPIPEVFQQFYHYLLNLNFNDEINLYIWRNRIYNMLGKDIVNEAYGWLRAKSSTMSVNKQADRQNSSLNVKLEQQEIQDQLDDELTQDERKILSSVGQKLYIDRCTFPKH